MAADWALLVVALLVAYDAGGAVLVGLVSLTQDDPGDGRQPARRHRRASRRPERALVGANLVRAAGAALVAAASLADATLLVFAAVALASAAGALVRPTVLTLLPAVAASPAELVSANTAGALGESLGTFVGPLAAGLIIARVRRRAGGARLGGDVPARGRRSPIAVRVPDASRPARARAAGAAIPIVGGHPRAPRRDRRPAWS